jgi:catechol 2,3-dioxygenase-like lactoylglutathione lyase family enzyme
LSITDPAPPVLRRPEGHDLAVGEAMLAVRTSDIATVRERLDELGARILLEPMRSADGRQTELVVHDPDGIRIHVVQRAD